MECPWCHLEIENVDEHLNTINSDITEIDTGGAPISDTLMFIPDYFHPMVCDRKCADSYHKSTTSSDVSAFCVTQLEKHRAKIKEKFDRVLGERFRKHRESGGRGIEIISRVSTALD